MDDNKSTSKLIIDPIIIAKSDDNSAKKSSEPAQNKEEKQAETITPSLSNVIRDATEDESPQSVKFSLQRILGGEILNTNTIKRQIGVLIIIAISIVLCIAIRYRSQQDLIEIDNLTTILQDAKYKALSSSSQLTEKSRESNVLNVLKNNRDSVIQISEQPPYIINVPK